MKNFYEPTMSLKEMKFSFVEAAAIYFKGNITKASLALGVSRATVFNILKNSSYKEKIIEISYQELLNKKDAPKNRVRDTKSPHIVPVRDILGKSSSLKQDGYFFRTNLPLGTEQAKLIKSAQEKRR